MSKLIQYLKEVVERGGSDLHISPDSPPMMRLFGDLVPLESTYLSLDNSYSMLEEILEDSQLSQLERFKNIDFIYEVPHAGKFQRFRCNFFFQKIGLDGVFRVIPQLAPSLADLNLPPNLEELTRFKDGLVIVSGPTGSGKSTTITTLVDIINKTQSRHIITIEDPIEFIHTNQNSIIHQRQINLHTLSFERALQSSMRQDPDIIIVSEMRDLATIELSLTAASTGYLVFTTMHTPGAVKVIDRLIEFYSYQRRDSVRLLLADCLRAIVSQQLILRADDIGLIPAVEIMINCIPISNLIRENRIYQVNNFIKTGKNLGMVSMDDYLLRLYEQQKITAVDAYEHALDKKHLESVL